VVVVLVHVPPGIELLNVMLDPTHTSVRPLIAVGTAVTVTVSTAIQPVVADVNVMTEVPAVTPLTTALLDGPGAIVATVVVVLVHVPPPAIIFVSVVEAPAHTVSVPVMGGGGALTFIVMVLLQLFPRE
jgi:hypothetical protein